MEDLAELKQAVHAACLILLEARIHGAEAGLEQAREAGRAETKSSAGDKHETARAMAQVELEKQVNAVRYLRVMEAAFRGIDPLRPATRIASGALVCTDQGHFYVSAALGGIVIKGTVVQAISMQAPVLTAFAALALGETVEFRGKSYRLLGMG